MEVFLVLIEWVKKQKKSCQMASKQKTKKLGALKGVDKLNGTIF